MSSIAETAALTVARTAVKRPIDGWRWAGRVFLTLLMIFTVLPMVWMVLTSLKSQFAAMQYPPQWWPAEPTLDNYARLLDTSNRVGQEFLRYFGNVFRSKKLGVDYYFAIFLLGTLLRLFLLYFVIYRLL